MLTIDYIREIVPVPKNSYTALEIYNVILYVVRLTQAMSEDRQGRELYCAFALLKATDTFLYGALMKREQVCEKDLPEIMTALLPFDKDLRLFQQEDKTKYVYAQAILTMDTTMEGRLTMRNLLKADIQDYDELPVWAR